MSRAKNLTGMTFGRLTAKKRSDKKGRDALWECECSCGKMCVVASSNLRSGRQISCGCLKKEKLSTMTSIHNATKTRLFTIWNSMLQRCENPNSSAFRYYGERGINVCAEWHEFLVFRDWAVTNGYEEHLTIDRIDNEKGYSPENCRWVTIKEQQRNRTNNRVIEIDGVKHTLSQWAEISGVPMKTIWYRLSVGKKGTDLIAPLKR